MGGVVARRLIVGRDVRLGLEAVLNLTRHEDLVACSSFNRKAIQFVTLGSALVWLVQPGNGLEVGKRY
jgi:hypothetical protein